MLRFWKITCAKNLNFPRASSRDLLLNGKQKKPFVLLNDEVTKTWHLPLAVQTDTSVTISIVMLIFYCCFVSSIEYGAEQAWFELARVCFDTSWGQSFFWSVSLLLSKTTVENIYFKKPAVKAAKSYCLSLCGVEIHLRRIVFRGCLWKTEFFLYMLFLKNKAQINKNSYKRMLFMSKQVSLPKNENVLFFQQWSEFWKEKIKFWEKCLKVVTEGVFSENSQCMKGH